MASVKKKKQQTTGYYNAANICQILPQTTKNDTQWLQIETLHQAPGAGERPLCINIFQVRYILL